MAKYDDASWHYGGDYPEDLPNENAATHIGMFMAWCIENDLMSEEQKEESGEDLQKVIDHKMTGAKFLINNCDEKFIDEDLSELGNDFTKAYYENDAKFAKKYSSYDDDFAFIFDEYETSYHVEDTWENYERIKKVIDQRFQEWKEFIKI
jgi:hypothetical protein